MHDGRFNSLDKVFDHYQAGITNTVNLDPNLQKNNTPGIALSLDERRFLTAFLKTLDDAHFVSNPFFGRDSGH
jgi:cytochrome c peroxidase